LSTIRVMIIKIKILKDNGIGVLPTDTLYGIVGSAFSKKAVERIYKVRGRNPKKPCIILISSINDLKKFGISQSLIRANRRIVENVWPGKVSVVFPLPKEAQKKFSYLHRGTKALAFRLPKKKSLIALLKKTGPLVAPSANPEGKKPAETITEAKKYFGDKVDFYLFEGKKTGKPSKIISLVTGEPIFLRK
jgi:L-threonylcarbamoyladenylate synthase